MPSVETPVQMRSAPGHSGFVVRMSLFFAAIFLIYGVHVSYFPVWLHARGLTPSQIGVITALPIFLRVAVSPAIAGFADAGGRHRQLAAVLAFLGLLLLAAMISGGGYLFLLVTAVPFAIAVTCIMPLTETIAVSGVRAAGHNYGRMRLWGSLAFLAATIIAGKVSDTYGPSSIIYVLLAAALATLVCAALLPDMMRDGSDPAPGPRLEVTSGQTWALLAKPKFALFIFAVGCILCSHAMFYTFGAIHLGSRGISGQDFGILWSMSVFAETALLWQSAHVLRYIKPLQLIMLAALAGVVRWGGMSLDPPFAGLCALQALHGLTYGATHLGAIHFMARAVPQRCAGAAQGLYSSVGGGLFTGVATLASGQLYPVLGGASFLVMALISGGGLVAAFVLSRTWHGEQILDASALSPTEPEAAV